MSLPLPAEPVDLDDQAERATVGALVLAPSAVQDDVLRRVRPADFADPQLRWIVDLVDVMRARGEKVDQITLVGYARTTGMLPNKAAQDEKDAVGSAIRRRGFALLLHELVSATPDLTAGASYAGLVADAAARRRMVNLGRSLMTMADGLDIDDLRVMVAAVAAEAEGILGVIDRAIAPA